MIKIKSVADVKLIKFIIVGVINTVVGSAIMFGLYNLAGCSYWFSSAANYISTSIFSFLLNKYFTFKNQAKSVKQIFRFILNIVVCYLLAYGIAQPITALALKGMSVTTQGNISMLVGMCVFTAFNYFGQRFFAFK